ncbi:NLI interacting factor-like phosphatase-domain-containing protein [Peziza echinospora]|nr:NLI interacting factor-like phosphatase-domain-containing protein [Peziza echinospora]
MNSLSILSSRVDKVIGSTPPSPTSEAFKELRHQQPNTPEGSLGPESAIATPSPLSASTSAADIPSPEEEQEEEQVQQADTVREESEEMPLKPEPSSIRRLYMNISESSAEAFEWVILVVTYCISWLVSLFYDARGSFSPIMPLQILTFAILRALHIRKEAVASATATSTPTPMPSSSSITRRFPFNARNIEDTPSADSAVSTSTALTSPLHARARSMSSDISSDDIAPRRSIRIRLYNENSTRTKTTPSATAKANSLKSPTSPSTNHRLTKYPRNPGPPRPLLSKGSQKTLILDLDETLIHSLAKGGRMSSGHMVEVKLERQHAILYYVHKRPYCDEFLRKVYKWYNLVVFTASVQEYADPVIDWLEQDRKYFKGRYYRQHCTNRNGTYIKDISSIEPDLSKVIILDNSPMSYMFHEDNAIPIEGWINDPTDMDLLNLIPLLHALHYVTDVRALLALRMGETI